MLSVLIHTKRKDGQMDNKEKGRCVRSIKSGTYRHETQFWSLEPLLTR